MTSAGRALRRSLDALYLASGVIAACFLVAILTLILLQMSARWFGFTFPGGTDYAGYCMAASSFFAFAYALNHGAHIRVSILLNALGPGAKRWLEIWCFLIGALVATYFARYAVKTTYWSYKLNDVSQGLDATPLWVPQLAMSAGTILFAIALWDHLARLIFFGEHGVKGEQVDPAEQKAV